MIEIEFDSMEAAVEAVNEISYLGNARIDKKINHDIMRNYFLNSNYEKALDKLKDAEKKLEVMYDHDENPVEYLYVALTVLKKLFESGKFIELQNKGLSEAEDKLFEIVAEMGVNDKFKNLKILKEEIADAFKNISTSPIKEPYHEDIKGPNSTVFEKPEESHPDDSLDHETSDSTSDFDDSSDSIDKFLEMSWKRQFLIYPILESVHFHKNSEDPYSCFMNGVYLKVTKLEDLFMAPDLRIEISSNIYVSYILNLGLEFILQKKDLIYSLSNLHVINEDVFEEIHLVSALVDAILSSLKKAKKVKYRKFIFDMTNTINNDVLCFEDHDVVFSIDSDFIELIIKDLDKIGLIKTKGRQTIKYAMK